MRRFLIALAIAAAIPVGLFTFLYVNTFFNDYTGVPTDFSPSAALKVKPAAWTEPATIKVVTFNIQDLLVVAKDHEDRMRAIAAKLSSMDPDIVGFQEAFIEDHRALLIEELQKRTRLRHFQYYPSGTMGSGVLTASAFPIKENWFHRYEASNPWWKVWEGDYWAGKGVGLARIELPNGALLDLFNTHAQASYGVAANVAVRESQMAGLGKFVAEASAGTVPAIVVGDLNSRIGSDAYNNAISGGNLVRTMAVDSSIDHILAVNNPAYTLEILGSIEIQEHVTSNGKQFYLSDHNGYQSELKISPAAK